mgnify:FL=1
MEKWVIVYEKECEAKERTVKIMSEKLCCKPEVYSADSAGEDIWSENIIYIGFCGKGIEVSVKDNACGKEKQIIKILGENEAMLLYAVSEFENKYIPIAEYANTHSMPYYLKPAFEGKVPEYDFKSVPKIKRRGFWSWGYVIYDYKKYIDIMVNLKLNTLIIWNDFVPENVDEVISYAHKNGIYIYLGFAWGWNTADAAMTDISDLAPLTESVVETYKKDFAHLPVDGIYFQSFTETAKADIGGKNIAERVTEFVNETAAKIFEISPKLQLMFGLHATSVKDDIDKLAALDERIDIIWEDCGSFPYAYLASDVRNFEETKRFSKQLQESKNGFGAVLKGLICLDWGTFKHQRGVFVLGENDEEFIKNKFEEKRRVWKYVQGFWLKNARFAQSIISDFKEDSVITALCEDGAIENGIPFPVALMAELMWDADRSLDKLIEETALRPDVIFA